MSVYCALYQDLHSRSSFVHFTCVLSEKDATMHSYCLISYNFLSSVQCLPAPNITCKDHLGVEKVFTGHEVGFYKPIACRNV